MKNDDTENFENNDAVLIKSTPAVSVIMPVYNGVRHTRIPESAFSKTNVI